MQSFDAIYQISATRNGVREALEELLPAKTPAELAAIPDDRWLAQMTRCIFRTGFN